MVPIFVSSAFLHSIKDQNFPLKFIFSKKATKIDEIFTVDLTLTYYIASNRR